MTNFEFIKNNMDINNLSYLLMRTVACPFDLDCCKCAVYTDNGCPLNHINNRADIIKWLESEMKE